MTLAEIKDYTTSKLGITDATMQATTEKYVRARWSMIWNKENWRQARIQATVAVTALQQIVVLPPEFEFVTAARIGGVTELLGISDASALAANPEGYDKVGPVGQFIPLGQDENGRVQIKLNQIPNAAASLDVIGKRKCVQLVNPTDTPRIPGADMCLCEYVMADLYEWLRAFGKMAAKNAAGDALLADMINIETQQSAEIRRFIPVEQTLDDGQDSKGNW